MSVPEDTFRPVSGSFLYEQDLSHSDALLQDKNEGKLHDEIPSGIPGIP